jgi:hypothetical protein
MWLASALYAGKCTISHLTVGLLVAADPHRVLLSNIQMEKLLTQSVLIRKPGCAIGKWACGRVSMYSPYSGLYWRAGLYRFVLREMNSNERYLPILVRSEVSANQQSEIRKFGSGLVSLWMGISFPRLAPCSSPDRLLSYLPSDFIRSTSSLIANFLLHPVFPPFENNGSK